MNEMKTSAVDEVRLDDAAALKAVALDYLEGWFEGDVARMERALHPELVKRSFDPVPDGGDLVTLTAEQMIRWTSDAVGRTRDVPDRAIRIVFEHVHGDIATLVVEAAVYIEFIHLVRTSVGWKIVNILWDWASEEAKARAQAQ